MKPLRAHRRRRPRSTIAVIAPAALLFLAALTPRPVDAQGVRGTVQFMGRTVEMRPLLQDTVSRTLVTQTENGNYFFGDKPAYCQGGSTCDYWHSQDVQRSSMFTADVSFTAWGLGLQGLSATAVLRFRDTLGSEFVWPRTDDSFDAMLGYLQYVRGNFRARLGRQRTLSGLGFSGFDGLDLFWEIRPWVRVEGYAGRSLARGLYEPRNDALKGLENFMTDQDADLFGGFVEFEPAPGSTLSLRYQRELWRDRAALVSERGSFEFRTPALRPVTFLGNADWDFAFGKLGKAHLTAQVPIRSIDLLVEGTARRYRPYFELWTIWGYFSPVAFNEGELRVSWTGVPSLQIYALGSYRSYEDSKTSSLPWGDLDSNITRFGGGASWSSGTQLFISGEYTFQCCAGAYLSSGELSFRWQPHWRLGVSGFGTAFQQIEEFRIGEGVGIGGGLTLDVGITRRSALSGGISTYQLTYENNPAYEDWDQVRAWAGFRIDFGEDPGLAAVRRRQR